jgi:hypothetical protein
MQAHLALESDALTFYQRPGTPAFKNRDDYHAAYQSDVVDVITNSGLWTTTDNFMVHVSPTSTVEDIEWFATHTDRTTRLRYTNPDEFVRSRPWSPQAACAIVLQVREGVRLINPIPNGCTTPTVYPATFMDTGDDSYTDSVLCNLFRELCRVPGSHIDVTRIIEKSKHDAWRAEASRN